MSNWTASTISLAKRSFQIGLFFRTPQPTVPRWESDVAELSLIWLRLAQQFFPNDYRLIEYQVRWSERTQKRVLGSCNLTKRRVLIARALDRPELKWALEALIYHEMCHAVVGIKRSSNGKRNRIHGREFYELERQHPGIKELDRWIKSGGWQKVVRSYSSHKAFLKRTQK
jgi:hypothetical protein